MPATQPPGVPAPGFFLCARCGCRAPSASPHVLIEAGAVRLFCSAACRAAPEVSPHGAEPCQRRRIGTAGRLCAIGFGLVSLSSWGGGGEPVAEEPLASAGTDAAEVTAPEVAEPRPMYGPPVPTERERAEEVARTLDVDHWIHPLPGPERRMPLRDSRVFGAGRPGSRPAECRGGHCGVDLGGERWGEPVFAVNEGVVDRINRRPHGNGGLYVRLAHRDGTVFTQYFHLAAIPRQLREGSEVRAGEVIGLVGDTGVDHSGPHLHFTLSVKPSPDSREVHVDPEPLIALWPVVTASDGSAQAAWAPGVPRGAVGRPRRRARAPQKRARSVVREKPAATTPEPETEPDDAPPEDAPTPTPAPVTSAAALGAEAPGGPL